jgi:hypothetical protein
MRQIAVLGSLFCACAVEPEVAIAPEGAGSFRVITEGTPEAAGVLALLNDRSTTVNLLDIQVALDARAARAIVAHRNGGDGRFGTADDNRFDTIAEVDGVPRVGDATLQLILNYAAANGWIPSGDPVYGTVEGVQLTVYEATDVLRVANGATFTELDIDAGLDARAAQGILDNRPYGLVEDVAAAPYIGASALRKLVSYGRVTPIILVDGETSLPVLEIATAGLWFTSESDYPLDIWGLPAPAVPMTTGNADDLLAGAYVQRVGTLPLSQRATEASSLDWFFDRYTDPQDWWDPSQLEAAPKWQALRDVFETQLTDVRVYRFGPASQNGGLLGDIDVFIVGTTRDGAIVGIRTVSIET